MARTWLYLSSYMFGLVRPPPSPRKQALANLLEGCEKHIDEEFIHPRQTILDQLPPGKLSQGQPSPVLNRRATRLS